MKRSIVFLVIISILFTFQIASPTPSANCKENLSMERSSDVSPNSFEKESPKTINKKKKSHFGAVVLITLGVAAAGAAIYFFVIKKPEYKLTVTAEGVTGTPASGIYTYKKGSKVTYNFTTNPGYKNLTVTLDGSPIASSGTITMDKNHTLAASALEKGNYTRITIQYHYVFKGLNTGGSVSVSFDKKKFFIEGFYTDKLGDANSTCEDGDLLIDKSDTWVLANPPSLRCSQAYYAVSINKSFPHFICPDLQIIVVSYTWETGKADPGTPIIKNPQDLIFDRAKMCWTLPGGETNCESIVTLEFFPPSDPQQAQRVFVVSACGR